MKKLEHIPKKEIFEVPDGYFERLPGNIQARISGSISSTERRFIFRYKLPYALPLIVFVAVTVYWLSVPRQPENVESLLASVQTEQLVAYLGESDLTTEDLLEHVDFNSDDLEAIENSVYPFGSNAPQFENLVDEMDLDTI
jgi:hypothetical protein